MLAEGLRREVLTQIRRCLDAGGLTIDNLADETAVQKSVMVEALSGNTSRRVPLEALAALYRLGVPERQLRGLLGVIARALGFYGVDRLDWLPASEQRGLDEEREVIAEEVEALVGRLLERGPVALHQLIQTRGRRGDGQGGEHVREP